MRLRWTRRAERQLDAILTYIARDDAAAAERVILEIEAFADILSEHPGLGRPTSRAGMRMSPVPRLPYLVFFRPRGDELQIIGIRHGKQRPLA